MLECLQSVQERLSQTCENELFKVKRQEFTDNSVDYALMTTCEGAIEQFCPQFEKEHVLECLKVKLRFFNVHTRFESIFFSCIKMKKASVKNVA